MILSRGRLLGSAADSAVDIVIRGSQIAKIAPVGAVARQGHEVIDLDGRWVTAGFWDEHVHFSSWAQSRRRIALGSASSAREAAEIIRNTVEALSANSEKDPILFGVGYRDGLWPDPKTRELIDSATGDTPVILISADLHSAWINSATVRKFKLGVEESRSILEERECFDLLRRASTVNHSLLDEWVLEAANIAASRGLVGLVDLEMTYNPEDWRRRSSRFGDKFPLQVDFGVYPEDFDRAISENLSSGSRIGENVRVGPLKLITDGALNTRTANCIQPYLGISPPQYGAMNYSESEIEYLIRRGKDAGFWPAIHAIGDQANRIILDIFERVKLPGRIEHAQLLRDEDLSRFKLLGVTASVQPAHAVDDRDVADLFWGDRSNRAFPLKSLVDSGATLVFGSDAPVSPLDPWVGIAAAVARTGDSRPPWLGFQGISISEAIAFSQRSELREGEPADIAVLEADPFWLTQAFGKDMPKLGEALRSLPVFMTLSLGMVTYANT